MKYYLHEQPNFLKNAWFVRIYGADLVRLSNNRGRLKISFQYPCNGLCYISLNQHAFRDFVFKWMGNIQYCHIPQSISLDVPFQPFRDKESICIHECDEELIPNNLSVSETDGSINSGGFKIDDEHFYDAVIYPVICTDLHCSLTHHSERFPTVALFGSVSNSVQEP